MVIMLWIWTLPLSKLNGSLRQCFLLSSSKAARVLASPFALLYNVDFYFLKASISPWISRNSYNQWVPGSDVKSLRSKGIFNCNNSWMQNGSSVVPRLLHGVCISLTMSTTLIFIYSLLSFISFLFILMRSFEYFQ